MCRCLQNIAVKGKDSAVWMWGFRSTSQVELCAMHKAISLSPAVWAAIRMPAIAPSASFSKPSGCTYRVLTVYPRPLRVLPFVPGVLLVQPSLVDAIIIISVWQEETQVQCHWDSDSVCLAPEPLLSSTPCLLCI